jgi:H+/Cl- antiporter ClcA
VTRRSGIRRLSRKQAILAVVIGITLGVTVAAIMTALDWRLNPGGIFHDDQLTNWEVVTETAFSWFLPITLLASVVTAIVFAVYWRAR